MLYSTHDEGEPDGHEAQITDLQWAPDRTYFITSSKDKTAKVGRSGSEPNIMTNIASSGMQAH